MSKPSTAPAAITAADAEAIRRLTVEFHYLIDHGRARDCLALLTADAKLIFGPGTPNAGCLDGTAAIDSFLTTRQAAPVTTRHLLGPARFVAEDPDHIIASSLITLFKSPADNPHVPAAIADLHETYVRTAAGWRLAIREVIPVVWS